MHIYIYIYIYIYNVKIRRTRHAVQWWKSKDERISDVLQWTPLLRRPMLVNQQEQ